MYSEFTNNVVKSIELIISVILPCVLFSIQLFTYFTDSNFYGIKPNSYWS